MNEQADLDVVTGFLVEKRLSAERFPREEMQAGRTPDFRVCREGEIVAYCEVKSPNDSWLDDQLGAATAWEIVGGARQDPIFNRIARLLSKADSQFLAVNPDQVQFNILAYVNHDKQSNYNDLVETITGYFHAAGGERTPTMLHIAEGRIGAARRRIDAFLWFDAAAFVGAVINDIDLKRAAVICNLLGFDLAQIK
jgi:hypothetical protein